MKPRLLSSLVVNGLLVLVAILSLSPLLWMLSVSFMQTGEAGHFPPPLLPSHATLANYRELFVRAGMGRFLFNSFLISSCVMLLSVLFNTLAGYAFAKLRFKGRDRSLRALLAALVIPAQVAMMPLFLLLKQMGLVNTYMGAIVPGMAAIFG
ncbi:MAG: carbohydrate ABC transporter permease, partial [Pseudoxanthomonas sp.]